MKSKRDDFMEENEGFFNYGEFLGESGRNPEPFHVRPYTAHKIPKAKAKKLKNGKRF